mmetsp:Transcript_57188/g.185848  ORF Transcript_57188/g.185848 Transcript_57188/m.185848 type:complete len:284 (+) Transcript_57188:420-1271(+)
MAKHQTARCLTRGCRLAKEVTKDFMRKLSVADLQTWIKVISASSAMKRLVSAARFIITTMERSMSTFIALPNRANSSPRERRPFFASWERRESAISTMAATTLRRLGASSLGTDFTNLRMSSMPLNCTAQSSELPRRFRTSPTHFSGGVGLNSRNSSWSRYDTSSLCRRAVPEEVVFWDAVSGAASPRDVGSGPAGSPAPASPSREEGRGQGRRRAGAGGSEEAGETVAPSAALLPFGRGMTCAARFGRGPSPTVDPLSGREGDAATHGESATCLLEKLECSE